LTDSARSVRDDSEIRITRYATSIGRFSDATRYENRHFIRVESTSSRWARTTHAQLSGVLLSLARVEDVDDRCHLLERCDGALEGRV